VRRSASIIALVLLAASAATHGQVARETRLRPFRRHESLLLLLQLRQACGFCVTVVVERAVDVDAIGDRIRAEGMMIPNDDIRVFADLERAHTLVDAQI
jgi:hypothetical protein